MALDVTGRVFQWNDYTYVSLCVLNNASTVDMSTQAWSSEMLHWDDYRAQRGVNDGTPPLSTLFPRSDDVAVPTRTFDIGAQKHTSRSVAVHHVLAGQPQQTFCSEMQHWDDFRRRRGMLGVSEPLMSTLFDQWHCPEFVFYTQSAGTLMTYKACSVALRKPRGDLQTFSSEMQHWDDVQRAKTGVLPQPCMAALFNQY